MDQEKMKLWFENYAAWRVEAQEELVSLGYLNSKYDKYHLHDDGSIFHEVVHSNGQRNDFQSCWKKKKVTPWKDSKHYIEM